MTRKKWLIFTAAQLVGCAAAIGSARFAFSAHERLAAAMWFASHYLLLPGNEVGGALISTLQRHTRNWYLIFLPVTAVLNAGFWLLCALVSRIIHEHLAGIKSHRYAIPLVMATILFVTVNLVNDWMRPAMCDDCFSPHGVPFALYHEGGYGGGEAIIWSGLAADALLVIGTATLFGSVWQKARRKANRELSMNFRCRARGRARSN